MQEIVFLEPCRIDAEPFTTSKIVADITRIGHKKIKIAIAKHQKPLETFGLLAPYQTESTGGRPENIYRLNEQQACLLVTFLKNTPVVVAFKTELVRQFYAMRTELQRREVQRTELKPIRRHLTDVIKEREDLSKWAYRHYTDLAYRVAFGKSAAEVRKERNAPPKAAAVDYLTSEEIAATTAMQDKIAVLVELGLSYEQIKATLLNSGLARLTA